MICFTWEVIENIKTSEGLCFAATPRSLIKNGKGTHRVFLKDWAVIPCGISSRLLCSDLCHPHIFVPEPQYASSRLLLKLSAISLVKSVFFDQHLLQRLHNRNAFPFQGLTLNVSCVSSFIQSEYSLSIKQGHAMRKLWYFLLELTRL